MISSVCLFVACLLSEALFAEESLIVIAHRGASGSLPEHTLAAEALAYGLGADYIEQDVVLTKDGVPIVLHDIHLDCVTDVAAVFPGRSRADGRYYAIDFTLEEVRQLSVHERIDVATGEAVFPDRFPMNRSRFDVPTLSESLELVRGLNQSTGRDAGVYPEVKKPKWHRDEGFDLSAIVLNALKQHGYADRDDNAFVQCFDPSELRRLREELGIRLRLVQLIGDNSWNEADTDYAEMITPAGLDQVAEYADGIGPWMRHVVSTTDDGRPQVTDLVSHAHQRGLVVHPFTLRADSLPDYAESFEELVELFIRDAEVDGLFTDFPGRVRGLSPSRPVP